MKIILSGGGTGGHIYPAIAIANALQQHAPTTECLFVGARGKMELEEVPAAGYSIVALDIKGLQRKQVLGNITLPFKLIKSLWQAHKLLKTFRPDVVVGTGGYASFPVLYMAARQQIPTLIQEQNAVPGLTNRLLGRYATTLCVAYDGLAKYFPAQKIIHTGNPVRQTCLHLAGQRAAAQAHFHLVPTKKCLLVLGGSLGARTINESIQHALDQLMAAGLQLVWVTGQSDFARIQAQLTPQQRNMIRVYPFIKAISWAYAAADIVVSRAGALAIAELCIAQKPVIFVPSPNVTADHQTQNVALLVAQKAAWVVKDQEARQVLAQKVIQLLQCEATQQMLAKNSQAWARPQAATTIAKAALYLAKATSVGTTLTV